MSRYNDNNPQHRKELHDYLTRPKADSKGAFRSFTQAKIAAGAVSTTELSNSGVSTNKIADDAVTSAKIAAGAVARLNYLIVEFLQLRLQTTQ